MNNEYYGVASTPTSDYLAHYGIKGMKWGVRKAIQRGNDKALSRQYRKAEKKLAKLEKRAANGKKYAKRAAALGTGAAAAGGLAAVGTKGVGSFVRGAGRVGGNIVSGAGTLAMQGATAMKKAKGFRGAGKVNEAGKILSSVGQGMYKAGNATIGATNTAGTAVERWGNKTHNVGQAVENRLGNVGKTLHNGVLKNAGAVSNNTLARIGAGAVGAGLAGAAGYNAYRAATTKRAAKKAAQFRSEMNKAFAGTKYANGGGGNRKRKRR